VAFSGVTSCEVSNRAQSFGLGLCIPQKWRGRTMPHIFHMPLCIYFNCECSVWVINEISLTLIPHVNYTVNKHVQT
jgi:hypothetical protein